MGMRTGPQNGMLGDEVNSHTNRDEIKRTKPSFYKWWRVYWTHDMSFMIKGGEFAAVFGSRFPAILSEALTTSGSKSGRLPCIPTVATGSSQASPHWGPRCRPWSRRPLNRCGSWTGEPMRSHSHSLCGFSACRRERWVSWITKGLPSIYEGDIVLLHFDDR